MLAFWGAHGGTHYLYAPKDDPLERSRWREPYGVDALARFGDLVAEGRRHGVAVGWAVSPGLDVTYSSPADLDTMRAKIDPLLDRGLSHVCLALDDIPFRLVHDADREAFGDDLAAAQAHLCHALSALYGPGLYFVPTEYIGTAPSPYLERLGELLDPDVDVGWTGPTVVSPAITSADAASRRATLRRKLLVWDNFPCNDTIMANTLHTGPLRGRDADLAGSVAGFYWNPMNQPRLSGVGLATAAAYAADPAGYDAEAAWEAAVADVGGEDAAAFAVFADACRAGPLEPRPSPRFSALADDALAALAGADWVRAWTALAARAEAEAAAVADLRSGDLWDEIAPWAGQLEAMSLCTQSLVRLVQAVRPGLWLREDDGRLVGRATAVNTEATLLAWGVAGMTWQRTLTDVHQVHGQRFGLYAMLVPGAPGEAPAVDAAAGLVWGGCVLDRLARGVFADCDGRPSGGLVVDADGARIDVADDGTFDVPPGAVTVSAVAGAPAPSQPAPPRGGPHGGAPGGGPAAFFLRFGFFVVFPYIFSTPARSARRRPPTGAPRRRPPGLTGGPGSAAGRRAVT